VVPDDVRALVRDHGVEFCVQRSPTRAFPDAEFAAAGAKVADDLADCPIVMGVKQIPPGKLLPNRTYVFFSHVIKGQRVNIPMLRRLMELKCQVIDYERIVDAQGRRLVFFGRFAGLAGMIDTLWAPYQYKNVEHAKSDIAKVGRQIRQHGLPEPCRPLVCGFAGYGQVSQGAQEIYDLLPIETVSPDDLAAVPLSAGACFKAVFHEKHMVERIDDSSPFELQEYYDHPERYRGRFHTYMPHLTVLANGIYWEPKYPRLVTRELLRDLYGRDDRPRLLVIGDISCDIEGSVECMVRTMEPDNPVYVYEPDTGQTCDGVAGRGPVILAVDHLPCELPVDSSTYFSQSLRPFIPALARGDFSRPLLDSGLPPELIRATIVYHGVLTEPYRHLEQFVRGSRAI
jgi:alpha-aminoadipic semialdehyde synthase